MICGTLIQTVILAWVTFRTDWTKEVSLCLSTYIQLYVIVLIHFKTNRIFFLLQVEEASKRLDKWSNKKLEVVPE